MRGRSFVLAWRETDTSDEMKAAYLAEHDCALRSRLHALWLLRSGKSLGGLAAVLGVHYRSVHRWVAWYRQGGLEAVRSHRMGGVGQVAFLAAEAQAGVAAEVATVRFRTAAEIRDWIAEKYEASYTVGGVYSLLALVQRNPKVPRRINPKADLDEQEVWKRGASGTPSLRRD
jgi:transposase